MYNVQALRVEYSAKAGEIRHLLQNGKTGVHMGMAGRIFLRVDFWIYIMMGLIFVSGILLCLIPVKKVQKSLRRAEKNLKQRRNDGSYLYSSPNFLNCDIVDDCWRRFLSNLELMRKNNAACEVYDFINPQTAIHGPGHSSYGEMVPGLLTTLGIVGSFYGIVKGLSTLDLSTTESMSLSISVLISGMRTAFNTSIAGAVLALSFQILRRAVIGSAERTLRTFVGSCQAEIVSMLTPDATLMQTLHAILAELRKISSGQN